MIRYKTNTINLPDGVNAEVVSLSGISGKQRVVKGIHTATNFNLFCEVWVNQEQIANFRTGMFTRFSDGGSNFNAGITLNEPLKAEDTLSVRYYNQTGSTIGSACATVEYEE